MATRRLLPSITSLPLDCTWAAARCRTRWNPRVCCGSASTPVGNCSRFSLKNFSKSRCSALTSPPHWRMILATASSKSSAYSTCSKHRNSWRRRLASLIASVRVISSSRLIRILEPFLKLLFFQDPRLPDSRLLLEPFLKLLFFQDPRLPDSRLLLEPFLKLLFFQDPRLPDSRL